jgi:hypothetical protein
VGRQAELGFAVLVQPAMTSMNMREAGILPPLDIPLARKATSAVLIFKELQVLGQLPLTRPFLWHW